MNTTTRTYYDVLGVAADTPDVVIKAAFRALAKEYHPDRTDAQAGDTDKFIEIQTAYAVLSKPLSRSAYDAELRETLHINSQLWRGSDAFDGAPATPPRASRRATSDIERICARLGLYSKALADAFHDAYLRGECGNEPWRFAEEMEKTFFRQHFGEDPDVQSLARLLLLGSHTNAARSLNQMMAGASSQPKETLRSILPAILAQHFPNDALFGEWLKVKFGVTPEGAPPAEPAGEPTVVDDEPAEGVAPPALTAAKPVAPPQPFNVLRSAILVGIWALALYFALFAALPMMK